MKKYCYPFSLLLLFLSCSIFSNELKFNTNSFQIAINSIGNISKLCDKKTGSNYLSKEIAAPLMSVRVENKIIHPQSAILDKENQAIILTYENEIQAQLKVESKDTHLTFELISISNPEKVDLIIWGKYPTTINKVIGETVGVVQGEEFAMGIQALNPKTLGGYPWQENDCMPQIDIFEQDNLSDLSEEKKRHVLYRVEAAKPEDFGSTLQAYCRNRNKERIIKNWNHEKYVAPVFDDGGVIGSKIALFGCPVEKTLETIGAIEISEGLPHPKIDGEWGKTIPSASAAYMIMGFGEEDIEKALDITEKAGLRYLYHPGPFENWGHFKLDKNRFPNGIKGMKTCVDKAEARGIKLGVHTLSNFITTNDSYITPTPDERLAKVGSSIITEDIKKYQTKIEVESPDFFNQFANNHLKTVVINNELIRYATVSEAAPWQLLDCQRGAFGTKITKHKKGDKISKLADHAYKVFLTNPELSIEVSKRIADLYNQTGLRQISFDGLEGNRSTGLGNYGEILFTQTWFDNLNDDIQQHYIADASRTSHYFWHMYTRMNWGEPWYAGFRESQTEYRLKNQKYFKRNLMPGMLGWFQMTPQTSTEDIEWMLARSAAFNAGYAFVASYGVIKNNGHSEEILKLLGDWENARMAGAFAEGQKKRMEDIKNEFHLEAVGENEWNLYQVYSYKFTHEKKVRQPGEPLHSSFKVKNPSTKQKMNFILTAIDGNVKGIKMEINNYKKITLPITLKEGETIKYSNGEKAVIYDKYWHDLKEVKIDTSILNIGNGEHSITFDCNFVGGKDPKTKLEIRFIGAAELLK
jgi:hypothetical protein